MKKSEHSYSKKRIGISIGPVLLGLLYYVFIRMTGIAIPCYFRTLTGWKCPGCGITEAAVGILQGNVEKAFYANRGLWISAPVMGPLLITCWYRWITNRSNNVKMISVLGILCIVFLIMWTIYRNIYGY